MKASIFAAASVAALVSAHVARSPLDLGLDVANLISVDLCLGLDLKLPLGISLNTDCCPKHGPPAGCTNFWNPPHDFVIDDCDNNESEWHYVRPCKGGCGHQGAHHRWTTSTITEKSVSTVIGCSPEVADCPVRSTVQTVVTIPATTTICPVAVTNTAVATVPAPAGPPAMIRPIATQTPVAPNAPVNQGQQPPATFAPVPPVQQQPAVAQYPSPQQPPVVQAPASQVPVPVAAPSQQAPVAPPPDQRPPSVVPAPAGYPAAPVQASVGTGAPYNPGFPGNTTSPVVGAASANGQKLSMAAAALGLAAILLLLSITP